MEVDIARVGNFCDKDGNPFNFMTAEALSDLAQREPDKFRFDAEREVLVCIKPEIIKGFDEAKLAELSRIGKRAAEAATKLKLEIMASEQPLAQRPEKAAKKISL